MMSDVNKHATDESVGVLAGGKAVDRDIVIWYRRDAYATREEIDGGAFGEHTTALSRRAS